ncbi:NAD-dependent epimerase [Solidesulfovibrio sp.]|uniref:NAD-dependent epimerase n=1 Tax=Solidesulfovibrio sp. TaxID=2910990 RepID=UPI000EC0CCD2|nr:NAD-dependent epimerase [Solidesulfovibrio sp.]MEA5087887.1 NAD-dependent epimerase [Solidesulfovibrio sp.]HCR13795.1 capsular biosynthesis protein CpsI [Desulfovibrio sp.]HML59512.1 NAD-dependent epimerase [Solidesulfovibrio sp.]
MNILVTGAAGFIGFHLCRRFLSMGFSVTGLDNLSPYYSVTLKQDRLKILGESPAFTFVKAEMADRAAINALFDSSGFTHVVNLAAQAGVRHSLTHPDDYINANIIGYYNILENCRHHNIQHFVFASSSSVYGLNTTMPFSVHDNVDHPISLYAASKKSNELMAHSYSYLFGLPCTGLRFFTVYGPWGRPDMALFLFTKAILEDKPIQVFNEGRMERDFTYIDDIVEGVVRVTLNTATANPNWNPATPDPSTSVAPYRLYNIGNNNSVSLMRFIECIEQALGKKAIMEMLPLQPGDVPATCANVDDLVRDVGFQPGTPLETGIARFIDWYREYYCS